jgi:vacuole morphology and inheritance protein 14
MRSARSVYARTVLICPQLVADTEVSVKNGVDLLDRLVKDIVAEQAARALSSSATASESMDPLQSEHIPFSVSTLIPLLSERIYTVNPFTRTFLISWMAVLNAIPQLDLVAHLPEFLDGLLGFVSDTNVDVRVGAMNLLGDFLQEIRQISDISDMLPVLPPLRPDEMEANNDHQKEEGQLNEKTDDAAGDAKVLLQSDGDIAWERIIAILLPHTRSFADENTQTIALTWLNECVRLAGPVVKSTLKDVVAAVLPCLAHKNITIRSLAAECDGNLRDLLADDDAAEVGGTALDYDGVINALTLQFLNESEKTRIASLEWLTMLHRKSPEKVCILIWQLF